VPISRDDPSPRHVQIADDLRRRIHAGDFQSGKLPGLRKLASDYDAAQVTVHEAFRLLQEEHLLISVAGKGTFVNLSGEAPDDANANQVELASRIDALQAELDAVKERLSRLEENRVETSDS
jgi:DNA-binding GntR family transcriptional regulator